jgi:fatty acid CoA ligase FadD9
MSADTQEEQLQRRIQELYASDPQFAAARPDEAVWAAIERPGLRLPQLVQTVMDGYANRPALGQRAVQLVKDPDTGRTTAELLPRFETITYRELWQRAGAIASAWTNKPVRPGDRVCILGFTSVDYTVIDLALIRLGAVAVPLQTGSALTQLAPIVAETEPGVIAASIDHLSDAVELVLTAHTPTRLVVFDHRPEVDDQREAVQAARDRLAKPGSGVIVETLADVVARGQRLPAAAPFISDEPDPLTLLIYTSGSTGAPKGAMYRERLVANFWRQSRGWFGPDTMPTIVLSFMPMSHGLGQLILLGTLGSGGTAYFAARSDLSTLLEDLALVHPTDLNTVPRVWEMLFQAYQSELNRRSADGADKAALEAEVMAELRGKLIGPRVLSAMTSSAPISPELRAWVEAFLDMHLMEGYGPTEAGPILVDGHVQRPAVTDYKLADVPELAYFHTDRPHPRGELLVKTQNMFAGYYKRPEVTAEVYDEDGYYCTGDIFTEIAPGQFQFTDRRNNVIKLSQGEFVAVSKVEAVLGDSPLVRQIYVYGNSARPYLVAVVVPTQEALSRWHPDELKPVISKSLQEVAKKTGLQSYEVPRDFIIETTPFTAENGLLTGIGKMARPKLKERYGDRLEQLYADLAEGQANNLLELRRDGANRPTLEAISRAAAALLGAAVSDLRPDAHFSDLGGDSLSALTFANLLHEIFDIDVPVGIIVSPATDLQGIADYIETQRQPGVKRPTFASVHGRHAAEVHAQDLKLDKFIDEKTLAASPTLPQPIGEVRTVLLTGATGFLGRVLALEWLERISLVGGTLICLVRAKSDEDARRRLDKTFDSGDPALLAHYRELANEHLEVIVGDKGQANLGLDQQTWQRLADTVDLIVDPAALVNHVLPYSQLFGPNVVGTAELIRIALTTKLKPYTYVSTVGVPMLAVPPFHEEDADVRVLNPSRPIDDSYANGYNNSKWAAEVLLREAHDRCGLPVAVFRCDMILADTRYAGQLNVPDVFTRTILSLVATGIAPGSFYELDAGGNRQRAHYDGLPVDFIADAIATLGAAVESGYQTYHVLNPYDDGIGLDQFVDWFNDAGYPIQRIADYNDWLQRFETAMRALPERERRHSVLPLLHYYQHPEKPLCGALASTERFRAAVQEAKVGPDKDIPHVTAELIVKYITDLQLLGLLERKCVA